jgi:hypothetical protein
MEYLVASMPYRHRQCVECLQYMRNAEFAIVAIDDCIFVLVVKISGSHWVNSEGNVLSELRDCKVSVWADFNLTHDLKNGQLFAFTFLSLGSHQVRSKTELLLSELVIMIC